MFYILKHFFKATFLKKKIFFQKHPEPFFALAKELYPGQFKVWNTAYGPLYKLIMPLEYFFSSYIW